MNDLANSQPTEAQARDAYTAQEAIKATIRAMRITWVKLAEQLYAFSEQHTWRALGYRSFEQWLADPDIDINRRNAFYLIESWRELVVLRGVAPEQLENIEVSKVREVMPAIRRGHVEIPEALEDARTLAREDLRTRYSEVGRPGTNGPNEQPLEATAEPERHQCPACGSWVTTSRRAAA